MCCKHLDKYLCMVPMIAYVCCWYYNGFNFFEHIKFTLLLPYVGHSTIRKDLGHFIIH
jgi:hypothetical protein